MVYKELGGFPFRRLCFAAESRRALFACTRIAASFYDSLVWSRGRVREAGVEGIEVVDTPEEGECAHGCGRLVEGRKLSECVSVHTSSKQTANNVLLDLCL